MSISRKENGSLVKKAGRALVDLALSLTSNNAVANSAVTAEFAKVREEMAEMGVNMTSRTIRVSGSTPVGTSYFDVTISPAIADLSKCMIIPSVRSTHAQLGYFASLVRYTNNSAEFCAPANGNTGGLAWDGTMQIIEWD